LVDLAVVHGAPEEAPMELKPSNLEWMEAAKGEVELG
jgi:hypothetical protein